MNEPQKIPGLSDKRRRIRSKPSVADTISKSRTTILVNMIIEIACATVLIVGVIYFIRFLVYFRENMVELYFKIFLGAIILFTAGWSVYIFIKLYEHYRLFKKAGKDKNDFEET